MEQLPALNFILSKIWLLVGIFSVNMHQQKGIFIHLNGIAAGVFAVFVLSLCSTKIAYRLQYE